MPHPKVIITTLLMILSLPFLAVGVGILFLALAVGTPSPRLDRLFDGLIDGRRRGHSVAPMK
jgi:hypothetical protein